MESILIYESGNEEANILPESHLSIFRCFMREDVFIAETNTAIFFLRASKLRLHLVSSFTVFTGIKEGRYKAWSARKQNVIMFFTQYRKCIYHSEQSFKCSSILVFRFYAQGLLVL